MKAIWVNILAVVVCITIVVAIFAAVTNEVVRWVASLPPIAGAILIIRTMIKAKK